MKPTLLLLLLIACDDGKSHARAVCALIDTSGTYLDQTEHTADILRSAVVPRLRPGDSLVIVRISSDSYSRDNVEAVVTLGGRSSQSIAQKSALADTIAELPRHMAKPAKYTDIKGGMMLCSEYLAELGTGKKVMLVFSDMVEDLPKGHERAFSEHELDGIAVVAMNVKRLKEDGARPAEYRARLAQWESLVRKNGAPEWRVIMEPEGLTTYLGQ